MTIGHIKANLPNNRAKEVDLTMTQGYYTEITSDCPLCGAHGKFIVRQTIYNMPLEGPTLIASAKCLNCGYRIHWITPYEEGQPRKIKHRVREPRDLNAILVVGENTDVKIPELGLELLSSELDQGFVTTVEGLLERFLEKTRVACTEGGGKCEKKLGEIREALEGRRGFTIELEARHGRSKVIPPGGVVE